jgi:hypothetical protein
MNTKTVKHTKGGTGENVNIDAKIGNVTDNKEVASPKNKIDGASLKAVKSTVDVDMQYKTILVGLAPKLSPKSTGLIGYEVALNEDDQSLYIRLTSNDSGGLFSKEWVGLDKIYMLLEGLAGKKPFRSSTFKTVIKGGSANNVSFLSAVLRCEEIELIVQSKKSQFLHVVHTDWAKHRDNLSKLTPLPTVSQN